MKYLNLALAIATFFVAFVYLWYVLMNVPAWVFSLGFGLVFLWIGKRFWKNYRKYEALEKGEGK